MKGCWIAALAAICVATFTAYAEPVATVSFSMDGLSFTEYAHDDDTFNIPHVLGASFRLDSVGAPWLPYKLVRILIPQDQTCTGVSIDWAYSEVLPDTYYVFPAQLPAIMGEEPSEFMEPDSAIYSSFDLFPGSPACKLGEANESGYRIVYLAVYPLRYRPAARELTFYSEIHLTLEVAPCQSHAVPVYRRNALTQRHLEKYIAAMVENPQDIEGYYLGSDFRVQGAAVPGRQAITELPSLEGFCVDYVVVTSDELTPGFQAFADMKTKKGVIAAVRTVSWIEEHYTGCDVQERIRNFIKDAYSKWGTMWVLLGGDTRLVPYRLQPYYWGPSDLYFADLEGSWNLNGNSTFGEWDDLEYQGSPPQREYAADIWLGRAPVDNPSELETFVSKNQTYSDDPPRGAGETYLRRILLAAAGNKLNTGEGCQEENGDTILFQRLLDLLSDTGRPV